MNDLTIPPITPDHDTLTAAWAYAGDGWYVGPAKRGSKHPGSILGKDWQHKTSRDPQVIASWFAGTDHGLFLHAGRSGAIIFDVDNPDLLTAPVRQALEQCKPPYQSTRRDTPGRGHYIFAVPDGRRLGNGLGELGNGWGELRGENGVIIVSPSAHKEDGGRYQWTRKGAVPVLPGYLASRLPEATEAADAATDAQVAEFLAEHRGSERPELLDIHLAVWQRKIAAGESRHSTVMGHITGAMKEAKAGLVDAQLAADTFQSVFEPAVMAAPVGKQGKARSHAEARSEWAGILAWAAAQALASDPATTRARVEREVPPAFTEVAGIETGGSTPPPDPEPPDPADAVKERFPRLDWHALWADQAEQEYIHNPLLPARRLVAIYSAPKIGKSLLMLEMAVTTSRGTEFLGYTPDRRRRVLYVDYENDPLGDVRTRLQAMGYEPDDLEYLDYLSFPTLAALNSAQGGAELLAAVKAYGSEVVVIDTVSRAIDGEENSNDTWLGFYLHTGLQLKQLGVSMIRLDHSGKDESKGMRGGSAKAGDVDAFWLLTRLTDTELRLECNANRMQLDTKLLKISRCSEPLRHELEGVAAITTPEARVRQLTMLCDNDNLPADANREAVRDVAKGHGMKVAQSIIQQVIRTRKVNAPLPFTPSENPSENDERAAPFTPPQGGPD